MEQKQMSRGRLAALIAANGVILVLEWLGESRSFAQNGLAAMVQFYTEDSNMLSLIASAVYVVVGVVALIKGRAVPGWVRVLRYVATCCLTVTMLVVVTVLAPMMGGYRQMMLGGAMLYTHTLAPAASILTFLFLEAPCITRRDTLLALLPTVTYALVTLTLNITRPMVGPYPFLHVYEQPWWMSGLWFLLIVGGAWGIAWGLRGLNRWIHRTSVQGMTA